jgi:hypothetical protein
MLTMLTKKSSLFNVLGKGEGSEKKRNNFISQKESVITDGQVPKYDTVS